MVALRPPDYPTVRCAAEMVLSFKIWVVLYQHQKVWFYLNEVVDGRQETQNRIEQAKESPEASCL